MLKMSVPGWVLVSLFHCPLFADEPGLHNHTEIGIVVLGGTTESESINVKQSTAYNWEHAVLKANYHHLSLTSSGVESARNWGGALRYEFEVSPKLSPFLAESFESDIYSGFHGRSSTDVGAKYKAILKEELTWNIEAGYRYAFEDRVTPPNAQYHLGRLFTDLTRHWTETASTALQFEYLPNFTDPNAYRVNGEISLMAALGKPFSVKIAYAAKYDNLPPKDISARFSTMFTTAVTADF